MTHTPTLPANIATTVPVLDFGATMTGGRVDGLVRDMRKACLDTGFFYVCNHGVAPDVVEATFEAARRYFALSPQVREAHRIDERFRRGYVPFGTSRHAGYEADLKDSFDWGVDVPLSDPFVQQGRPLYGPNRWPEDLPWLKNALEAYSFSTAALGLRILRIVALSLELPGDFFDSRFEKPLTTNRLLHYPPQRESRDTLFGAVPHTDYGLLTVLTQDPVGGLEVQRRNGEWIDAPYIPGTFVINLGDLFRRWTNDVYVSNLHRVVNRSGRERFSFPTFLNPDYDTLVAPVPSCVSTLRPSRYEPMKAGDYLLGRLREVQGYRM